MSNFKKLFMFVSILFCGAIFMNDAMAYTYEVWESGGLYYWSGGSSSDLAVAVEGAMGSGYRDIHVLTSGTMYSTLNVSATSVRLYCHGNTFTCSFTGTGISNNGYSGFEIHDLTLRNVVGGYGIRCSAASNLSFTNVSAIDIGWIGMRIDSRSSNPWNYTVYNLYMSNCYFENCGSHGLETYSIDGIDIDGTITARNCGECGVLFNQSYNGTVETVDAYNCCWGGGYAGLRYANACSNITTQTLYADHCGRGFFIVQSGPSVNCHLNYAEIRECSDLGIWIENGTNCSVESGCCESGVSVSGSGSYANVSSSCSSTGTTINGTYAIVASHSGKALDVYAWGTSNGTNIVQWSYWGGATQQFNIYPVDGIWHEIEAVLAPGKALDVYNISTADGANINLWDYWGGSGQQFRFQSAGTGVWRIINRNSDKCIDVEGGSTDDGANVFQWTCISGQTNQMFQLINLKNAEGEIVELNNFEILLYPVPANNYVILNLPEIYSEITTASIFNELGQKVLEINNLVQGENYINISDLQKGMYFTQFVYNNNIILKIFTKQ